MRVHPSPYTRPSNRPATVTIPAGTYFLGDPCYAVPDEHWMPLLESCGFFGYEEGGSVVGTTPDGHQVLAFGTAHGDGTFTDGHGHEYSVDAGMIGLTPEAVGFRYSAEELARLGQVVTFDTDVTAECADGLLTFGIYAIDTDAEDEDEQADQDAYWANEGGEDHDGDLDDEPDADEDPTR